jgi:hypothetical protein
VLGPLSWRYPLADTANADRGTAPAEGAEAVVDLRALREVSPYGLVHWALLAAHNDRLLCPTRVLVPEQRTSRVALARAGLDRLVAELLCPVEGPGPWPPEDLDQPAQAQQASPVAVQVDLACRPVHGDRERAALAEELDCWLQGVPTASARLIREVTETLLDNQRDHSGAFDAFVAAGTVRAAAGRARLELAVGDSGRGLAGDGPDLDRVLAQGGRLARQLAAVTDARGMAVVRTGGFRRSLWATGATDLALPALRGTLVAVAVPLG